MANAAPIVIILCVIVFFFVLLLAGLRLWEQKQIARREASLTVANTFKIRSGKKRRRFSTTEYHDYGDDAKSSVHENGVNFAAETLETKNKSDQNPPLQESREQAMAYRLKEIPNPPAGSDDSLENSAEQVYKETSETLQSRPNNLIYSIDIV